MPSQERINSIADVPAVKQEIDDLRKMLEDLGATIKNTASNNDFRKFSESFSSAGSGLKGLDADLKALAASQMAAAEQSKKLADALLVEQKAATEMAKQSKISADAKLTEAKASAELQKGLTEEAKQAKLAADTKLSEAKAANEAAKAKQAEAKERDNNAKATAAEKKLIEEIQNDYLQLSKAYNDAALRAKNMALRFGENHPLAQEAIKDARDLKSILDRVDQSTSDYRRNVGNYASGFDSLRMSMQQILRETPSLAINLQTFFLAISNNLPMFVDAIEQAKVKNQELAASGQSSVPVFQQILRGLFSWQSALTVGITLLTMYGAKIVDWVTTLFSAKKSVEEITMEFEKFNEQVSEAKTQIQNLKNEIDHLSKLSDINLQIKGTNQPELKSMADQLDAIRAKSIDIDNQNQKMIESEDKLSKARSEAFKLMIENLSDADQLKINTYGINDASIELLDKNGQKYVKAYKKIDDEVTTIQNQRKELINQGDENSRTNELKQVQIAKQIADDQRKLTHDTIMNEVDAVRSKNEAILNSDRSTLNERLNALRSNLSATKRAIDADKDSVLSDPTKSDVDKALAIKKANAQSLIAQVQYEQESFKVNEEYRIRDLEANKSMLETEYQQVVDNNKQIETSNQNSLDTRLKALSKATSYQKAIYDEEYKFQLAKSGMSDNEVQEAIKSGNVIISTDKTKNDERLAIQKEYENKVVRLAADTEKSKSDVLKSELDKQTALQEKHFNDIKKLYDSVDIENIQNYADDVIALNNSLTSKKISYEKYQKERESLDLFYQKRSLSNQIDEISEQLNLFSDAEQKQVEAKKRVEEAKQKLIQATTEEETIAADLAKSIADGELKTAEDIVKRKVELEKQLSNARKALSDADLKNEQDTNKKRIAEAQKYVQTSVTLINSLIDLGEVQYDKELNRLQDEQDQKEKNYQADVERINNSTLSEEQKAAKLKNLESAKEAEDIIRDQKRRKIDEDKAKFEKAKDIMSIIGSTSVAVMGYLAEQNYPMAILSGIIGGAQLAKVIATPLPAYAKGTQSAKGGLSIVGEEGVERVTEPDGSTWYTPGSASLVNLKAGSKVTPHHELMKEDGINQQMHHAMLRGGLSYGDNGTGRKLDKMIQKSEENARFMANKIVEGIKDNKQPVIVNMKPDFRYSDYINKYVRN